MKGEIVLDPFDKMVVITTHSLSNERLWGLSSKTSRW
jgi:hypothetical protein